MKLKAFWTAVTTLVGTVVIAVAGVEPASAGTTSVNGQTVDFGTQVLQVESGPITVSVTLDPGMTLLGAGEDPGPGHPYIQADVYEDNGSCTGAVGPVTCQMSIMYWGRTVGPTSDSVVVYECPTVSGDCPQIGAFIMTGYGVQGPAATSTAVTLSPSAPAVGQATRFTATVTPDVGTGTATGSVQFKLDGLNLGSEVTLDGSGHAVSPAATPSAGPHSLTATFSPAHPDDLSASSRTVSFTVRMKADHACNGSFESPVVTAPDKNFISGQKIGCWTVGKGNVDLLHSKTAADGVQFVDLDGTNADGEVHQTVATIARTIYTISFKLSGNPAGAPTVKTVVVTFAATTKTFQFSTIGVTATNLKWQTVAFDAPATTSRSLLSIKSTDPANGHNSYGAFIDVVSVAA